MLKPFKGIYLTYCVIRVVGNIFCPRESFCTLFQTAIYCIVCINNSGWMKYALYYVLRFNNVTINSNNTIHFIIILYTAVIVYAVFDFQPALTVGTYTLYIVKKLLDDD